MNFPTGTVTFLFTDIEGSTRLWEEQPGRMRPALARHDGLLRSVIEDRGGVVFKTVGDAFCAAFAAAPDAVAAALDIQRSLRAGGSEELPLRIRMALHTGSVEHQNGDYFGPPLNRVARLLAIGHGGQVLLSAAAAPLASADLPDGAGLRDLGEHALKDLREPERVWQLIHPALPADFPPLNSLSALPNNLPIQLTSFIGRDREMVELKRLLDSSRLVTLTGSGGSGKTRLAVQVAADLLEEYPQGIWLVELASLSDGALIPQTIASTVGLREEAGRSIRETLLSYLQQRRALLLLDNCEHLLMAAAQLSDALLRLCPRVGLLVTSREPLRIAGEVVYRVPSLSLPGPKQRLQPDELERFEAARLFLERAASVDVSFHVDDRTAAAVAQVCRRLDGIPLAIELAAARVRSMTVEQIADRLDDRFRLLKGGSRAALPRQQTLRATLDWSYDLLGEPERLILARVSVFAGGWSLEPAESICSGGAVEDWELLDLLTSLVDKSLVIFEAQGGGNGRYRMSETVRQYARDLLNASGEADMLLFRHRDFFLALAEEAEPQLRGPQQGEWLDRLEVEHDNLRAALDWSLARAAEPESSAPMEDGSPSSTSGSHFAVVAARLAGALSWFWTLRGYWSEGRTSTDRAVKLLESAELGDGWPAEYSQALTAAGTLAYHMSDYAASNAYWKAGVAIRRRSGDKKAVAGLLNNLGILSRDQGDYDEARKLYEEALALRREIGDEQGVAGTLNNLGLVLSDQKEYEAAHAHFNEALSMLRQLGDRYAEATTLNNLGKAAYEQGKFMEARSFFEQGLRIREETRDTRGLVMSYISLAHVVGVTGDPNSARSYYERALEISREIGDQSMVAYCLDGTAGLETDPARARGFYQESLRMRVQLGERVAIAHSLFHIAATFAREGEWLLAARIWGASEGLREALNVSLLLPPGDQEEYRQGLNQARAALGEEAFRAIWNQGRSITQEQAVEQALSTP